MWLFNFLLCETMCLCGLMFPEKSRYLQIATFFKHLLSMINKFLAVLLISILFVSCAKEEVIIQNPKRIADVQRMLTEQKSLTSKSLLPIWDIFKQPLTESEKQVMEFL